MSRGYEITPELFYVVNGGVAVSLSISVTICEEKTVDSRIKWNQRACVEFVVVRRQWCHRLVYQDAE